MKLKELKQSVNILDGVTVKVVGNVVTAKGPHGEVSRKWTEPKVSIVVEGNKVIVSSKNATKNQKRMVATMKAQIKNAVEGVKNNNEYKMKVCSSHFPIQVSMEGQTFIVKNYFGEKVPRKTTLTKDVQVKIAADKITITGPDVEKVGQTAGKIEEVCRITNRDRRRFQDGIYLTERNGNSI